MLATLLRLNGAFSEPFGCPLYPRAARGEDPEGQTGHAAITFDAVPESIDFPVSTLAGCFCLPFDPSPTA